MKIIGNLIKILVLILLVFVLIQNADEIVDLKIFTLYYSQISLAIVLLLSLGFGAILGALLMGMSIVQTRGVIKNLEKKNKQLAKELENLRNISVDEIPEDTFKNPGE
ncbi:MAG: hypothetical protein Kow0037_03870 [Calditrichia bacterium]